MVVKAAAGGVNLPPELISDIISRLPVKCVGRLRCVSKNWQTLLSDKQFLKIQFTRNNHNQFKLIINQGYSYPSIDFQIDCNNSCDPIAICEKLSFEPTHLGCNIRGSCNGLLLIHDSRTLELSIANPITHESRQLPAYPNSIRIHFCRFGFGYCSSSDEYVVVIISDYTCSSPVFMLKGNLWKRVENSPSGFDTYCAAFVNGAIHWLGSCGLGQSKMIYAFDLAGEKFREVELPEGLKKEDLFFHLHIVGGCLCGVVCYKNLATDIWVMKEYGVRESWTRYVNIPRSDAGMGSWCLRQYANYSIWPLFFWNGDKSIVAVIGGRLVLCCLKQGTTASIPVIGERSSKRFYDAMWTFVDSLFSPNSSNAIEGPNQVHV